MGDGRMSRQAMMGLEGPSSNIVLSIQFCITGNGNDGHRRDTPG